MPNKRDSQALIELRRRHVARFLATMARPSVRRIRDALLQLREPIEVTKSTVQRDIDACKAEWRAERLADMDEIIGKELLKLALAEEQLWAAASSSARPVTETQTRQREVLVPVAVEGGGTVQEVRQLTSTFTQQVDREADPRYFRGLVDVFERRARLLGLDRASSGGFKAQLKDGAVEVEFSLGENSIHAGREDEEEDTGPDSQN